MCAAATVKNRRKNRRRMPPQNAAKNWRPAEP
jgi:hypothetical protein